MLRQNGASLIEILISVAVMGVMLMAFTSMWQNQSRETRALSEKLASLDLERALIQALTSSDFCDALLQPSNLVNAGDLSISNANNINPASPRIINLKSISGSGLNLATLGKPVSPMSNSLEIAPANGLQLIISGPVSGEIVVTFNQTRLIRAVPNLRFPLLLQTTFPANPMTVLGCRKQQSTPRIEGGNSVSGSTCLGNQDGVFCDTSYSKQITFAQPFQNPPVVLVSGRHESIHKYCSCCHGASDQNIAAPFNITKNGFQVLTSISPFNMNCGLPYANWSVEMDFDWIAVGE